MPCLEHGRQTCMPKCTEEAIMNTLKLERYKLTGDESVPDKQRLMPKWSEADMPIFTVQWLTRGGYTTGCWLQFWLEQLMNFRQWLTHTADPSMPLDNPNLFLEAGLLVHCCMRDV